MKKLISVLLALVMALSLCATAWADDPVLSGTCGAAGNEANVSWALADEDGDGNYTLTISGTGAMKNYNGWRSQPWQGQADHITKFVVEDGVTTIGISATDGENMIEEYVLGNDVETINDFGISTYAAKTFTLNGNMNFKVVDGVLFDASGTTLFAYPGGRESIDVYEVPNGVTAINGGAFNGAKMKKLIFGSGSVDVESWSFQGCTAEYMELNGTNLTGSESFRGLSKLKDLKIAGGSIPGQFFCGVAWTGGPSTAAIEKIIVSTLPSGSRPFFLQNKLTTVDLSQCTHVSNASEGVFSGTNASKIAFYFDTAANATAFQSTSAYESKNAIFAVLNGGILPSKEGYYSEMFALATPVKDGYIFEGWYADAQFSGSPVTTAVVGSTYYAKWEATHGYGVEIDKHTLNFTSSDAQTVTVSYNGTSTGSISKVDFDDGSSFAATVNGLTVTVAPKAGLPAGTYHDTMYIHTGDDAVFVVTVSATVEAASNPGNGGTGNNPNATNPYIKDEPKAETPTKVESSKTFDPGVALYAGMALVSAAGMAWTVRKRGE